MPETKRYLKEYEIGETFTLYLSLRKMDLRTTRNGAPYLVLEVGDKSGRLRGNIWEDADRLNQSLEINGIIKMRGRIETYQGNKQVSVLQIRNVNETDEYELSDFLPETEIDRDRALKRLLAIANGFKNGYLKQLINDFFNDETLLSPFRDAPAGKLWHHNRLGGLLEHTLSVTRICRILSRLYPESDRELLLTGAMFHDVGKIEEYRFDSMIDYTTRGRLIGHITIGATLIDELISLQEDFPTDLRDQVLHLILAHQGEREYGSTVAPSTREAFLLYYADLIDSKMDALRRIEDGLPEGREWEFVNLLGRFLHFKSPTECSSSSHSREGGPTA